MNKKELIQKIKHYGVKVDKATKTFIKERLVSIEKNEGVYSFSERTPYGKRRYQGSGVYRAYDAIVKARESVLAAQAEDRDVRANPDMYLSDEEMISLCSVGRSGVG